MITSHESSTTMDRDPAVAKWYGAATVRTRDRILVPDGTKGEFLFPRSRQVLSGHPLVSDRGQEAVAFVLAQSAYQYMYGIGLLETRYVTDCALNIVNGKIGGFTDSQKREALTIVIDEGYHAYVALDFIIQMKAVTGVEPVEVPETNGNLGAVGRAYDRLPEAVRLDFQLVSVCLAEHTLTKDLLTLGREKDMTKTFTQVMTDHVSDEGRHASYFARMMTAHWARLPDETKRVLGEMLPAYLDDYLAGDTERTFDRKVLRALGLGDDEVERAVEETSRVYLDNMNAYITRTKANLIKLLERSGFFEHPVVRASFAAHGAG